MTYTLHYHYERPHRLWWDFVEGDGVAYIDGEYLFEPLDGGERTRATYRLGVDAGVPVPGFVARKLNEERDAPLDRGDEGRSRAPSGS